MLSTEFCGFALTSPFLLASGPATRDAGHIVRGLEAGWAGAVTKTISLEPSSGIRLSPRFANVCGGFLNLELLSDRGLDAWLADLEEIKRSFPDRLLVASIAAPAYKLGDWKMMSEACARAGADALELNLSCPHGISSNDMGITIGQSPELTREVTGAVCEAADVPVMVKLGSNVGDVATVAAVAERAGAASVSAINTVPGLGEIDIENLMIAPSIDGLTSTGGLSGAPVKPIALRVVADVRKATSLEVSGIGGIMTWQDACEFILVGARTVQVCTGVMLKGFGLIDDLKRGLADYMMRKRLAGLRAVEGRLLESIVTYGELRMTTSAPRIRTDLCRRDDLCYISCRDAGGNAISLGPDRYPIVDMDKCLGCSLCMQVCPSPGCITMEEIGGEAAGDLPGGDLRENEREHYGSGD
ncbi:MAG: NAD-dependent dihydropyrimidine dehydrogenase subunit PreA [bacterium]|jgi:dihydropyrimidine dehydrogenase (NAD+) subunit PreA